MLTFLRISGIIVSFIGVSIYSCIVYEELKSSKKNLFNLIVSILWVIGCFASAVVLFLCVLGIL